MLKSNPASAIHRRNTPDRQSGLLGMELIQQHKLTRQTDVIGRVITMYPAKPALPQRSGQAIGMIFRDPQQGDLLYLYAMGFPDNRPE